MTMPGMVVLGTDTTHLVRGKTDQEPDIRRLSLAMAGVAQWTECRPRNQRVAGSIPSQGTCLGCKPGPQVVCEMQPHIDVSLPLFLSPCPSLKVRK